MATTIGVDAVRNNFYPFGFSLLSVTQYGLDRFFVACAWATMMAELGDDMRDLW